MSFQGIQKAASSATLGVDSAEHTSEAAKTFFQGQRVSLSKAQSGVMSDALEELSFANADRILREHKDRSVTQRRAPQIDQLRKYLDRVAKIEDLDKQKYLEAEERHNDLKSLLNQPSIKDDDVTQRFYGLLGLLQNVRSKLAEQDGKNPALSHLERELSLELGQMEQEHGAMIRAGANIEKAHSIFAGELSPKALRAAYKETILDYQSLSIAYGAIIKQFGGKRFKKGLLFLLKAVGADLHASMPSGPKNQLARIIEDMFTLKILISLHERCDETMSRLFKRRKERNAALGRHHKRQSGEARDDDLLDDETPDER